MLFLAVLVSGVPALSQVVTSDPAIPYANQGLTVYFDATQGSGGLAGYTGDVHAHTGVITSNSTGPSDWKYVKTEWDENTPETQLTRISDDYYKLEITPDIQTFYGVPAGETISQVAFVFRSSEPMPGSSQYYEGKDDGGKDIFIDVFEEGLNVSILSPSASSIIVDLNDTIQIVASASLADSISLYINDLYTRSVHDSDSLTHQIIADEYGDSYVCVYAYGDGETVADSFFY